VSKAAEVDTSGFQNIVLMLVGVLMIMLISNVLTIISNPDNIKIGAIVSGSVYEEDADEKDQAAPPKFQNMSKNPVYVEVRGHELIIYPDYTRVKDTELRIPGNPWEKFIERIATVRETRYIVLLLRPDSALFQRQLRRVIKDHQIEVGFEPWDTNRRVSVAGMVDLSGRQWTQEDEDAFYAELDAKESGAAADEGGAAAEGDAGAGEDGGGAEAGGAEGAE
jgi:hypothetical protein